MKFCSTCGTAGQSDALFCSKCGDAFEFHSTATKSSVDFERKNITVVVKNNRKTPIFSIFGISCGVLGIFTLGFIFIPLGFLFTIFGLLRGEFLTSVISGIINFFGLLTSPVLLAVLGLSVILGSSDLTKQITEITPSQVSKPNVSEADASKPASVDGKNSNAANDESQKNTKTAEEIFDSAIRPVIEASQRAARSTESISDNFSEETYLELQSLLAKHEEHCPSTTECAVKDFKLYPEDIDGDGKPEFIVTNSDYCGVGGCTTLLMVESSDHTWHRLASVFGDISVDSTSTLGMKDIHFQLKVYRTEGGWDMAQRNFVWTGNKYINNDK